MLKHLCKHGMSNSAFTCFQIAAKIGGDGVPAVTNNGGPESYPFPAQKRSLEEAGGESEQTGTLSASDCPQCKTHLFFCLQMSLMPRR